MEFLIPVKNSKLKELNKPHKLKIYFTYLLYITLKTIPEANHA
jgi:hypothetical protein